MSEGALNDLVHRAKELRAAGYEHAFDLASFEARIEQWPVAWGDDFVALIFGDFEPPENALVFDRLGITIEPEKLKDTVVNSALSVLQARVAVREKSIAAVKDAARRLNLLIGVLSYRSQGAPIRWWSWLTNPTAAAIGFRLGEGSPDLALSLIELLPQDVQRRVTAALYWLREPRSMLREHHRADDLAVYAGYWNAFECLVDAVSKLAPPSRPTREQKVQTIRDRLEGLPSVGPEDIAALYRDIVDPGFRAKAEHAVRACAGERAENFISHCFYHDPANQGLYAIRNAINHGTVDVDDPETAMVVGARFPELWGLVFTMLTGVLTHNLKSLSDQ